MTCSVENCDQQGRLTRGMCSRHYQRLHLYGDVNRTWPTAEARFMRRIKKLANGCWEWTGSINPANGYGRIQHGGKRNPIRSLAHRFAYELLVGPIPEGLTLDHLCHTVDQSCPGGIECPHRRCVNPAHLEPVTSLENSMRGKTPGAINAAKTHCKWGHEFTPENTGHYLGHRICRKCRTKEGRALRSAASETAAM